MLLAQYKVHSTNPDNQAWSLSYTVHTHFHNYIFLCRILYVNILRESEPHRVVKKVATLMVVVIKGLVGVCVYL